MSLLCFTIITMILAGSQAAITATPPVMISADLGANATLPCRLSADNSMFFENTGRRVSWIKVQDDETLNENVMISMGLHKTTFGSFEERVFLQEADKDDASIIIQDISMKDAGRYRCEILSGMDEVELEVVLEVMGVEGDSTDGVVFPYFPSVNRYSLTFENAEKVCLDQGATIASHEQLLEAWKGGLDWCNAGWLSDGTVQYPITKPRAPCGGSDNGPGLRNYGRRNKKVDQFDVFCYATALKGDIYWLVQPERLSFDEAVQACLEDGAEIAKVGHIFAAWKLEGFDRCDAGWLADGSVRYPISKPRKNCSPTEAAVRFVGFPDKTQKLYGVYCYKAHQ